MSSPIPDSPAPGGLGDIADAGFADSPSALSLCGFKIPFLTFKFKFKLPSFAFPPPIPFPNIALALNCALLGAKSPTDVTSGLPNGGGRKGVRSPDPDDEYDKVTTALGGTPR